MKNHVIELIFKLTILAIFDAKNIHSIYLFINAKFSKKNTVLIRYQIPKIFF